MDIGKLIKEKIEEEFSPLVCEVINESAKHKGHAGDNGTGQTHFKLRVVSSAFDNQNAIARQRSVYRVLNSIFDAGLHAISMKLISEKEHAS